MSAPTVIDLFCGAGGLSEGFRQAGFRVLAGNDIYEPAAKTFKDTHPEAAFFPQPIEELTAQEIMEATGLEPGELDVLAGGPPCQAYSVYNHQRGMDDSRSRLFEDYLKIVEGLQPKWVVMENVRGITSIAGGRVVKEIEARLGALGYKVDCAVLKAEEFGVPQERRRVFFIGNRVSMPVEFPCATHGPGLSPFVTIDEAIGDLPPLENGEITDRVDYSTEPRSAYQHSLRGNQTNVANHSAPKLGPINMERMEHIPQGGSWRDIPKPLLPAGMKRAKRSDHTKRYGRMRPDGLSCTILTKCDVHWGAYIHPHQDRAISVREAARLQSFPDTFEFAGSRTEQYVQVGNAVPPVLAKCVAEALLKTIRSYSEKRLVRNRSSQVELALTA